MISCQTCSIFSSDNVQKKAIFFFLLVLSPDSEWGLQNKAWKCTRDMFSTTYVEFMTIPAQCRQKLHHFWTEKRGNIMGGWIMLSHHMFLTSQEPAQKVTSPLGRVRIQYIWVCQHDTFIYFKLLKYTQHEGSRHLEVPEMVLAEIAHQSEPSKALGSDTEEHSLAEHTAQKSGCSKAQNCLESLSPAHPLLSAWAVLHMQLSPKGHRTCKLEKSCSSAR